MYQVTNYYYFIQLSLRRTLQRHCGYILINLSTLFFRSFIYFQNKFDHLL
jgi:hypothetical protein